MLIALAGALVLGACAKSEPADGSRAANSTKVEFVDEPAGPPLDPNVTAGCAAADCRQSGDAAPAQSVDANVLEHREPESEHGDNAAKI
jgi:hypothetical protein